MSNYVYQNIISEDNKKSSDVIQLTEFAQIISTRIAQIENGFPVYTDVEGISDPRAQAMKEFFDRKTPLQLCRIIRKSHSEGIEDIEIWNIREMDHTIVRQNE